MQERCELREQEYIKGWSETVLVDRAPSRCIGCLAIARSNGSAVMTTVDTYDEAVIAAREIIGPDNDIADLDMWANEVLILPADDSSIRRFVYENGFEVVEDMGGQILHETTDFECIIEKA